MLARLDPDSGLRQMAIAVAATVLAMVIPVMIRKMYFLKKLTWLYAAVGAVLLLLVLVAGSNVNGAKININLGGFVFQPSEFVKIIFVFFVASRLYKKSATFMDHVITTAVAAVYVLILVLSRDLGSAAVFFITYVVMLYVATKRPVYLLAGLGSGCIAALIAYFLFSHVRQRVVAWQDPFSVWKTSGYQILQGLFAIGAGGWFGVGLGNGSPDLIPFVQQDYMFAAICEELGGLFAICMILVCMSMFLLVVNISYRIKKRFYKLIALGLGTEYAFQVFLTIGGVSKFIPMTGITLPLVSYGGSSVLATIIMLAIIQGLYILREDEMRNLNGKKKKFEKQLRKEEELLKKKRKKVKKRKNREYSIVSCFFVLIFVSLIGYLVYFNIWEREDIISSPYNSRQNQAEDRIVRGSIIASGGEALAYTQVDDQGNETESTLRKYVRSCGWL